MAMLTDDEYKDFEAQIKLQEKVFLAFSRIFQKFSGVYWLFCGRVKFYRLLVKQESGDQNKDSEKLKEKVDEDGTGTFYSNRGRLLKTGENVTNRYY